MPFAGDHLAESPDARSPPDAGAGEGTGVKRASDDSEAGAAGGARKKRTTPGGRGVANLTPEQLAKKRANGASKLASHDVDIYTHTHTHTHIYIYIHCIYVLDAGHHHMADSTSRPPLDREAQRAIRERTRNQIEALERRIKDLTDQKPYQELLAVVKAKEAVEQENADIKRQLANVMAILQPLVGTGTLFASLPLMMKEIARETKPLTATPASGIE
jgi:hypothetical protein